MNMKKKFATGLMTLASTVLLAACGSVAGGSTATGSEIAEDTFKIGFNFELSGDVSSYGIAEKNGAELAVKEINAAGGIDGKKVEILSKDTKSDTAEAANTATALVTEGANVIIGPAVSGAAGAATASVTAGGVPMISPSATQDNLVFQNDGKTVQEFFFRATFVDSFQGQLLSNYLTDKLSAKKVALYYDNSSDYSKGITDTFKSEYKGEIVEEGTYAAGDTDFQAFLTKIKGKEFDAFVVIGYYNEAGSIVKQARELGIDAAIVGPDGFDSPKFVEQATAEAASKVYYLSAYSPQASDKAQAFYDAYKKEYGEEPAMFSAMAYDSVYMAAEAAKGAKTSVEIKDNLAKLTDFEGVTGTMSIDENHNVIKSAYVMNLEKGEVANVEVVGAK